jgi:hypothetical protein
MKRENQSKILVTGSRCHALGANTKLATNGLCGHPNKRPINPNCLDGLPISERDWTHCIFCRDMKYCYFAGDCEHRIPEQEGNHK